MCSSSDLLASIIQVNNNIVSKIVNGKYLSVYSFYNLTYL